ncbi:MAG: autotransporter outer membrane beta-barrel domain-containing protein [Proteobacteria bacterium]|nr:autotransporter domain-containing protein [Pseudomonadota bacterium]NOG59688.1 autotransporter outer membrane beta-barrel domain-containing protein [Pseudomonadota bacterium]
MSVRKLFISTLNIMRKPVFYILLLSLLSGKAFATDISGTYSGTINITRSSCVNPADDGNDIATLTLTLSGQSNGNFIGNGTGVDSMGTAAFDIKNGTTSGSSFNFNFDVSDIGGPPDGSGTASGTFSTSYLNISGGGSDDCIFTFSGMLNKTTATLTEATASSSVTDAVLFNTQIQSTINDISGRIGAALNSLRASFTPRFGDNQFKLEGMTGLNAGDESTIPYGIWGNYSYTDYENDLSTTAFDGTSHSFMGGIDFGVLDNAVIGLALGFENSDIDTTFNNGNQNTDSFTIAPYFGAILDDVLSVDFNLGYSRVEYDQFRTFGTTRITSSPQADRWFSALNLNAIKFIDRWVISGRVGTLFASSVVDSFTESNGVVVAENRTKVGTMSIAGEVAHGFNNYEPFLNLAYNYDFALEDISTANNPQPENDKDDLLLTTGVRFFEKSGITGNLEYSKRLLRDDFDEDRLSLTVRIDY